MGLVCGVGRLVGFIRLGGWGVNSFGAVKGKDWWVVGVGCCGCRIVLIGGGKGVGVGSWANFMTSLKSFLFF